MSISVSSVYPTFGGIDMDSQSYWDLFMETGAPELYMLYRAQKMEEIHVRENKGTGTSSSGLQ